MVLSVLLMLGFTVNVTAGSKDSQIKESNIVMSTKASNISKDIINILSDSGAKIKDDSVIAVLKVSESKDTAICITNFVDEEIEQDVLIAYTENESGEMIVDNSIAKALAQGYDHNMQGSYPPLSWDGSYIVHAIATAARYHDSSDDPYGFFPYYKPYKCSFSYVNYDNVTVNSIDVKYITEGAKYSYPGFEYMNDTYSHIVNVNKVNPVAGTTYTAYNYFPENFALSCTGPEDMVLTFTNRVNGSTDSFTVRLFNSY